MGFYSEKILPHLLDRLMSMQQFAELRREVLKSTEGVVLELGMGSGLNLPFYSSKVTRLIATEPSDNALKMAKRKSLEAAFPVEFVRMKGEEILLPNASVDQVVTTWTLCTIPDVGQALKEVRRVLKPGGKYLFLEHGASLEDAGVLRWQNRLNPVQNVVCGGCHLNRRIDQIVRDAGFEVRDLKTFYMKGPKVGSFMYRGVAVSRA